MEPNQIPPPPGQGPSVNPFGPYQPSIEDLRAGFGIRLGAIVIDGIIAAIFAAIITLILTPFDLPMPSTLLDAQNTVDKLLSILGLSGEEGLALTELMVNSTYASAIGGVLYMLIEGLTGASIGKRILGLTVACADGTAGNQSLFLSRMFVKNSDHILQLITILPLISVLSGAVSSAASTIGFVLFIGCFLALGRNRQALHDMVVKTAVFKVHDVKKSEY